jgi:antitoxin ParD1/3/4
MQPIERLSITLPAEMARMIRARVEDGAYATTSEVIRDALRLWQEREELHRMRGERARAVLREAVDDPRPSVAFEEVIREPESRAAEPVTGSR